MRRAALLSLMLALSVGSCASTLRMTATAPTMDNDGTCTVPALLGVPASAPRVVHFAWTGPASGEDSIATTAGATVTMTRNLPPGTYTIRAWASDAGGPGCDTTITRTIKAPPWRPLVQ